MNISDNKEHANKPSELQCFVEQWKYFKKLRIHFSVAVKQKY